MPDIIKDMIKRNMQVEAVDLICAFELGEKFPVLPLLSSFVQKTCEKEASQKQLVALKLVKKCLNEHKLDASELASLDIDQKIANLEKEMSERKFQENKRRIEDVKSFKNPEPRAKRPWPASTGATYGMIESSGIGLAAGSIHGQPGGRHGNEVMYVDSVGPSLLGTQYLPGNNFTGQSAAGGESFYKPPALPHSLVNNFTGHSAVAGQSFSQPPALPHSSMNNFSEQSAAAGQGYYYPSDLSHGMGDVALGNNLYQFADTALQHDPYYGKPTPSNAVPTVANTGHHDHFGDGSFFNRSH
ncbi:protein FRIGIDA-like [Iris pallida]|uniref:FRIGIDA-like protein n=1 Tax=Iris pallida TaxID=29817 RepID=A0AAX6DPN8_IRIPA|nr:protein FRIGIDA-like [Iris pallida]